MVLPLTVVTVLVLSVSLLGSSTVILSVIAVSILVSLVDVPLKQKYRIELIGIYIFSYDKIRQNQHCNNNTSKKKSKSYILLARLAA